MNLYLPKRPSFLCTGNFGTMFPPQAPCEDGLQASHPNSYRRTILPRVGSSAYLCVTWPSR